jgi:hypothetical protein
MHVAMLRPISAHLPIHPIHVLGKPIPGNECHSLPQLLQHRIQLRTARPHAQDNLTVLLTDCRGECEIVAINIELLGIGEGLATVNSVARTWGKITSMSLQLWVTPFVALPIWVAAVIPGASMVCYLLHIHVPFIHVKLCTTTQSRETLRVTVIIVILSLGWPWHAHQVEIQIATATWAVSFEINIYTESFARKDRHVKIVFVAVICGRRLHEVKPVRRSVLDCFPAVNGGGPR